jgi:hypothetical protein
VLVLGCDSPRNGKPSEPRASAAAGASAEHAGVVLVAEPRHDFGRALQGDTLRHTFVTRNTTSRTVHVEDLREVLGCSGEALPRVLAPGATGELAVACRAIIYGPLRVSLPLRASGRSAGELALAAEVEPLLAFDRALLEIDVPFGTSGSAEALLRGARAGAAQLELSTRPPAGMAVTMLPQTSGEAARVTLRVGNAGAGTHAGSLRFATGLGEPKEIELAYLVKVASTLTISPTNPVLDLGVPAGTRTLVRVASTWPGFRVQRVAVPEGPFVARVQRDGDGYAIEVAIDATKVVRGMRGANGRLLILSNDRAEPRKEVPLFALGSTR